MKKNLISLAVAASVLGGAAVQAGQYVNPDNTGQVLLFPFYNADNGNATTMHIANTTGKAKAVKIRFVEYKNSDEVLDFNLYMSPYDHFSFAVIGNPEGEGAAIRTADTSCTVPALGSANGEFSGTNVDGLRTQPFVNYQYAKDADATIGRTLTGHVEVIEMGVLVNVGTAKTTQWADFATHGATGVPANCAGLVAGFPTAFAADDGVTAQEGGLYGMAYHIDVAAAASFGFEATAIDDWAAGDGDHTDPGSVLPGLGGGTPLATIHSGTGANQYTEITAPNSSQAISAILMTESLSNEVLVNSVIGGMTDWVVTFPTKRLHVDEAEKADVVAPFVDNWVGEKKESPACEVVAITQYDREEQTFVPVVSNDLQFSPLPPAADPAKPASICNEVAIISMGDAGSALNVTTGLTSLPATYAEGWQSMAFANTMEIGGATMTGLPVVGFGAYKSNNGAMSYGNTAEHKRSSNNVVSS